MNTLAELRCQITALERAKQTTISKPMSGPIMPVTPENVMTAREPRLPQLGTRVHTDDLNRWIAFWEHYEQTTHHNAALPPTAKFSYSRHYLPAEGAAAIAWLTTSDARYADSLDVLKKRLGNRKTIEQYHLTALRGLPQLKAVSDVRGLMKLYDATK